MPDPFVPQTVWTLSQEDNDWIHSFRDSINVAMGITQDPPEFQDAYARNVFFRYLSAKAGEKRGDLADTTLLLSIYSGENPIGVDAQSKNFVLGVDASPTDGDFISILDNPQRLAYLELASFYFSGNLVDSYFKIPRGQRKTGPLELFMQAYQIAEPNNDEIEELILEIDRNFIFLDEFFYDIPQEMPSDKVGVGSRNIYGNFQVFARAICLVKFFSYTIDQVIEDYEEAIQDEIRHDGPYVMNLVLTCSAIEDAKSYLEGVIADFDGRVHLVENRIRQLTGDSNLDPISMLHQLGGLDYNNIDEY